MMEKGQDERYTEKELNGLRRALIEAEAARDTEAARMQTELVALQSRHAAATVSLRAEVATAQGTLDAAEAHNARVDKREAYWMERFHQHCQDPAVQALGEEELNKRLHADMLAFQA